MTNDRFRDAIEIDFTDEDIDTKKQLQVLMRVAGYNKRWDKDHKKWIKRNPTNNQLDYAWDFLKRGFVAPKPEQAFVYEEKPPALSEDEYIVFVRNRRKRQVRSRKTGKIIRWIE